ncbi:unnamed protein product, partial [Rotaria sp. Silwood1]
MPSKKIKDEGFNNNIASLLLGENVCINALTANFYATLNETDKINFVRLEKDFFYLYGKCTKLFGECYHEHQSTYRQTNLCSFCRENEVNVYKFIQNIAGHHIDSAIKDSNHQQDLYKNIIIVK